MIKLINIVAITVILISTISCKSQNKLTPEQQAILTQTKANFVFVKGGTFTMGNNDFMETGPEHQVTLDSYSIAKYETTWKEYDTYCIIKGLDSLKPDYRDLEDYKPNYGVKAVTWQDAKDYCVWLGKHLQLPIDLPTEAQWEYAARSRGLEVEHATNNGKIEGSHTEPYNYGTRETVGFYPPNPLGLYDMSGGRPEWVRDWLKAYPTDPVSNPVQDTIHKSKSKVVRGVHTLSSSVYRRAFREPENSGAGTGVRCVCNQKTPIN